MSVSTVTYNLIKEGWKYRLESRATKDGGTVESLSCVQDWIDTLTAINISGTGGGLQEYINKDGGKITAMVNAQKVEPPRITYQRISVNPSDTKYDVSRLDQVTVRIACHARYMEQVDEVLDELRTLIDRYSGTVAGVEVQSIQYLDSEDQYSDRADMVGTYQDYKLRIVR